MGQKVHRLKLVYNNISSIINEISINGINVNRETDKYVKLSFGIFFLKISFNLLNFVENR